MSALDGMVTALHEKQNIDVGAMVGQDLRTIVSCVVAALKQHRMLTVESVCCCSAALNYVKMQEQAELIAQTAATIWRKPPPPPPPSRPQQPLLPKAPTLPSSEESGIRLIPYRELHYGEMLGQGGFGVVYQGEWQNGTVAIKELLAKKLSADVLAEFKKEANIWGRLHHPNIVALYGISVNESSHYSMVMELMPCGSLYEVLHNQQPLDWTVRLQIARDVAAGLTHLHEQDIVHCDLKSLNVLLGEGMRAKLTDFGLSKVKIETKTTTKNVGAGSSGTIRWMAPELLSRGGHASKESDVYAFGMILWELASRRIPFEDTEDDIVVGTLLMQKDKEKVPEECERAHPSFAALIAHCWEERSKRPTIQQAAKELRSLEQASGADEVGPSNALYRDNLASTAVVPK